MSSSDTFEHDFLFLRSADADGKSYGGFQWPLDPGGMVEAPDWNPEPVCGGGLHGLLAGLGDWGLMHSPGATDALWYVCGAIRSEIVDLDGQKIKVPRCRVLCVGAFAGAMEMMAPAMTSEIESIVELRTKAAKLCKSNAVSRDGAAATASGESGAATASGNRGAATASGYRGAATASGESGAATASGESGAATASGYSGAATASGNRGAATASGSSGAATASGDWGVAIASGWNGRARVSANCLLVLVERNDDGEIVAHFSAMAGEEGVEPDTWYRLEDGKPVEVTE